MTVRELIQALSVLPQDVPVRVEGDGGLYDPAVCVENYADEYVLIYPREER